MERMEWISIILNPVLQMLPVIIPPQWCSIHIAGEVVFGFIFEFYRTLLTQELIFICVFVYYAGIFFTAGKTQTGSSKINHSPTHSCWNIS